MLKKNLIGACTLVVLLLNSCATDVDLTGEYKETAVIYALMDPADNPSVGGRGHYFRIQKAFLGDLSAVVMAQEADSNYFPYSDLLVELLEIIDTTGGPDTVRHVLDTVMVNTKDVSNGSNVNFFGPQQRLYKADIDLLAERTTPKISERSYGISVTNTKSGYHAFAYVKPLNVNSFKWKNPVIPLIPSYSSFQIYSGTNNDYVDYASRFQLAGHVRNHEMWLRFHYREVSGIDTLQKSLYWRVGKFEQGSELGGDEYTFQVQGKSVFAFIGSTLVPEAGKTYLLGHRFNNIVTGQNSGYGPLAFDLVLVMAGTELSDALDLNSPSNTTVVSEVPVYSNIENGIGIFSTRATMTFSDMYLKPEVVEAFKFGEFTGHIGFGTDQ